MTATRREIIQDLRSRGVTEINGRGLTKVLKKELIEHANHLHFRAGGESVRHFSQSQISEFLKCPLQYYWHRIERVKIETIPASWHAGTAYHRGIEVGLLEKIVHPDIPPPLDAMTDAFNESWKDDERVDWKDVDKAAQEDAGLALVELYRSQVMPRLFPERVEDRQLVEFDRPWDLMVVPDFEGRAVVDGLEVSCVIDHKRVKKTPNKNDADSSAQLTAYSIAHEARTGKIPDVVMLHHAVGPLKRMSADVYTAKAEVNGGVVGIAEVASIRTDRHVNRYLRIMDRISGIMETARRTPGPALYAPANEDLSWWCAPDWCRYFDHCHEQL